MWAACDVFCLSSGVTQHIIFCTSNSFFLSFFLSAPPCLPLLSEFYDSGALMLEEEGAVMGGLLVGLNVIDANLCIKGEDLDSQVSSDGFLWVYIYQNHIFSTRNKSVRIHSDQLLCPV